MDYVVGLPFTAARDRMLVIRKARPAWQAGRFNGIGGKIEPGETPLQAMIREAGEEAALVVEWEHVAILKGDDFRIDFFTAFDDAVLGARSLTDEMVGHVPVPLVASDMMQMLPNLPLMVSLALDRSGIAKPVFLQDSIPAAAN